MLFYCRRVIMKCEKCDNKPWFIVENLDKEGKTEVKYVLCTQHYLDLCGYMLAGSLKLLINKDKN